MAKRREDNPQFIQTWQDPTGWRRLSTVNNSPIGAWFLIASLSFLLVGGLMALLMRIQLAVPENTFLGPEVYNQLFTMHGSTMMYLFAVPFLEGLIIYLLPIHIGSRDMSFPRISALGFWTFLFSGLMFYASFVFGQVPDIGWFAYVPLSGPRYSGLGTDFWLLGLGMAEFAGISAGIEIVVTVLKMRAPGMTLGRMPLFAWAVLVIGFMITFAFTTLLAASLLLEMDRLIGTRFFDPDFGGNPLLWQHLFWFFGHPEVYIIFLPATGIVSMIVAAFARRIVGYTFIATAIVLTGFVSFGLWVHHMYTTGLPGLSMNFFAAASLMIAVASGVQVFAWIASLWGSRAPLQTPLLFVLGFLFTFVLGGLTGVMVAVVPFDWQVHDTYFVVAHFHYVLIGGAVFPILGGLYFWLPKITGKMLSERLGKWSFWLAFIGFNVTFFPMHIMGFEGMPRRVYTYPSILGIGWMNLLATIGAFVLAGGFLVFVINALVSLRRGKPAGDDPWGGDSLEWTLSSPTPQEVFYAPPIVHGRHPNWDERDRNHGDPAAERAREALTGAPEDWRGALVTDALTARPQAIVWLPRTSFQPLLVSVGLLIMSVAALLEAYLLAGAAVILIGISLYLWLRPDDELIDQLRKSDVSEKAGLPIFTSGTKSLSWWGAVGLLAILGTILATLLYAYFYIRLYSDQWPQGGLPPPDWVMPAIAYGLLILSAGTMYWASRSFHNGKHEHMEWGLGATAGLGVLFLAIQILSLVRLEYSPQANAYASAFYALEWLMDLYVPAGIAVLVTILVRSMRRPNDPHELRVLHLQVCGLLWYFNVVTAILVFATAYVSPYVI